MSGNAKLTLIVDGTLSVYGGAGKEVGKAYEANSAGVAGINVPQGTTLTVRGTGMVKAYGGDASPGSEAYFWTAGKVEIGGGSGGGGAGAGIGGNGGAAGKGSGVVEQGESSSLKGYSGGAGAAAGTIYIYETVTVYAYGGGGGSGGRGGSGVYGDAGGGGGYPAAGVGGGGAGGGGGTNGAGGGGFSGGGAEGSFTDINGGADKYEPGGVNGNAPTGGDKPLGRGSGGAYFGVGTLVNDNPSSHDHARAYIGGEGGPWITTAPYNYTGGNGGSAGNGGTVKQAVTAKLYAYNGSATTTSKGIWGQNQTPIYWQNGHSLVLGRTVATTRAQMESGSYYNADRKLTYKNPLSNSNLGVGSGAGYAESSNGTRHGVGEKYCLFLWPGRGGLWENGKSATLCEVLLFYRLGQVKCMEIVSF